MGTSHPPGDFHGPWPTAHGQGQQVRLETREESPAPHNLPRPPTPSLLRPPRIPLLRPQRPLRVGPGVPGFLDPCVTKALRRVQTPL